MSQTREPIEPLLLFELIKFCHLKAKSTYLFISNWIPKSKFIPEALPSEYPINFLDFETLMDAVPNFDNQKPYQQIPFQYSLHICDRNNQCEHKEFLGDENRDPRKDFIENLLNDLSDKGSVIVYNKSFEKKRIEDLAELFPHYASELLAINN